ncbi:phasin family protein [Mesorhizobium sp. B2-4-19]|uniref:phasin family protein n=1 Tax=Mesorhizobium sp. B2-4-19 TaxID=2589930 RepID=UPI001FED75A1|nr:phasin family protein [Mesorhizobium sp. B2-4-19]
MHSYPGPQRSGTQPLPMADNGQKVVLAAVSLQAHAFKAMMRYQIETLAFLRHRCEQDIKLADDLIGGPEFNDAFEVVATFLHNAASDYVTEAGKVATLTSKLASEAAGLVRNEARTAIEDIAVKTVA